VVHQENGFAARGGFIAAGADIDTPEAFLSVETFL